jgi:biofilm PGA synthesis lipoprotein PgaB
MEKAWSPEGWLKKLVARARAYPDGLKKTVFKLQSYDWARKKWIPDKTLLRWMRVLVAAGAQHIGYYPDDCLADRPQAKAVRLMMSLEDFPFRRGPEAANEGLYR